LPAPKEIAFENDRISNFEGLVTLTLTVDRVILHTIVHRSSTSTYMPNFIETEETFCGRTDVHTYIRTDGRTFETGCIRSNLSKSRSKKWIGRRSVWKCFKIFYISLPYMTATRTAGVDRNEEITLLSIHM